MRNLTILLLLLSSGAAFAQIRAFDNSKVILPYIYNPSTNFTKDFQAYVGYDGRGNSSFTPQSFVAGLRMPVLGKHDKHKEPSSMMGVQLLNTSQALAKSSAITASFAHKVPVSSTMKLAMGIGAGIYNMNYNTDDLVYLDQQDPLLNNGGSSFNIHLNAGFSLVMEDKLQINLAAPALIKDNHANLDEIILRVSHIAAINLDMRLISSANLDTYNNNVIFGADIRAEWKKMISVLAGADRYKYHAGLLFDVKQFQLGYTYGQNYANMLNNITSHQICVLSHIPYSN